MNEERFTAYLAELLHQRDDVLVGPGDDAAVLDLGLPGKYLLAAADQVISGKHYLEGTALRAVAKKLLNRNLSDIAAMGGEPTHALLALAANPLNEKWLKEFYESLEQEARRYGVSVIGGDISSLPEKGETISLTILGTVVPEKLCLRSKARSGDLLYCTGTLGNSFHSGHHLNFKPRLRESAFLAGRYTNAMIDISDGLLKDSMRMALASGLAVRFPDYALLPLRQGADVQGAFTDGEDYELLFAVRPELKNELEKDCAAADITVSRIGVFLNGNPGTALGPESREIVFDGKEGFDHFHEK